MPDCKIEPDADIKSGVKAKSWLDHPFGFQEPHISAAINIGKLSSMVENSLLIGFKLNDIDQLIDSDAEFERNENAFEKFIKANLCNPKYRDKYVVFVHENLYATGNTEAELVKKVYKNFGNIDMYVSRVSQKMRLETIESPELC